MPEATVAGTRGFLTMAHGKPAFIEMAINLGRSLKLFDPGIPRAIVTDALDYPGLGEIFDHIVPISWAYGRDNAQKTHLIDYSPFDETVFLDSDCLAFASIAHYFTEFGPAHFGTQGVWKSEGKFWYDIATICRQFGLEKVATFNGGLYYYRKTPQARQVFTDAQYFASIYQEQLRAHATKPTVSDEVCFSLAMGRNAAIVDPGLLPYATPNRMCTPDHIDETFWINVLETRRGKNLHAWVFHYFGNFNETVNYYLESYKIKQLLEGASPAKLALVDAAVMAAYRSYIAAYSLAMRLRGRPAPRTTRPFVPLLNYTGFLQKMKIFKPFARWK